ncbi:MAG: hypothetical protein IKC47_01995, partial [Clostridia bacterium]|nr:hypothetical protein [Clostridia bacterium]
MIQLNSDAYYKLGRKAVLEDDYEKALSYFLKAGDYHSQINATILLCYLGDMYLAHRQYLQLYQAYKDTHNVNNDVMWAMRGSPSGMRKGFFVGKTQRQDKTKISAAKSKLFQFGFYTASSAEGDMTGELGRVADQTEDLAQLLPNKMAVVGTDEYFDLLIEKMSLCYLTGEMEKGAKYVNQIVEADSNYPTHLQLKLMLLVANNNVDLAVQLAQRLMDDKHLASQLTLHGKLTIADVLFMAGKRDKLHQFFRQTTWDNGLDFLESRKLICLATHVDDYNRAVEFVHLAPIEDCLNVNLDYLLTSSIAFYNNGQLSEATSLAKRVLATLPNNVAAKALLDYYHAHPTTVVKLDVPYPQLLFTPYHLPKAVAQRALEALQGPYDANQFAYNLSVVAYYECGYYLGTNKASFCSQITQLLTSVKHQLSQQAVDVMTLALLDKHTSPRLKCTFLFYLTKWCKGRFVVVAERGEN